MNYSTNTIIPTAVTILASDDYQAVPLKLTESAKAGMPITADGAKAATGENAIGILLYDVDVDRNPNGAVVVKGILDWSKCQKHNGEDLNSLDADAIAGKLLNIVFRDAEGKTHVGTGGGGDSGPKSLNDLSDVTITGAAADDVLTYEGGVWKNKQPSEAV